MKIIDSSDKIKVKLLSYNKILGANINRNKNRDVQLQPLTFGLSQLPNLKMFFPQKWEEVDSSSINLELILKIETNYKMILSENSSDEFETHYIRMEGIIERIDIERKS